MALIFKINIIIMRVEAKESRVCAVLGMYLNTQLGQEEGPLLGVEC